MNRAAGRRVAVIATPAALAVAVLAAVGFSTRHREPASGPSTVPGATAKVIMTDLSDSQIFPGTLGFGSRTPVSGHGGGMITKLPKAGSTPVRGRTLYRVDDRPVTLFYGTTPLFRTLRLPIADPPAGSIPSSTPVPTSTARPPVTDSPARPKARKSLMRGRDVTVVADNLTALGYDIGYRPAPIRGGDTYTASLAAAVRRWQKHLGMRVTGTLGPGQAIVLPGPVRVDGVDARLGDDAAGTLMTVSSKVKMITVPIEAGSLSGISAGDRVQVVLPDSTTFPGSVTSISRTVKSDPPDSGGSSPPILTVSIRPRRASDVAALDSAPVQVRFNSGLRQGVLAVPVSALLAVRGGGYALQRPDGSLVAVETGLFADGLVEVKGAGVTVGMPVQTAS